MVTCFFRVLTALSTVLWENDVPFMSVQTTGFIGWIRLQLKEHTIIESHPDNPKVDTRLDMPFTEVATHMDSIQMAGRDDSVKAPWLVLLYKALESYMKQSQNGDTNGIPSNDRYPSSSKHKQEFKSFLKDCTKQFFYFKTNLLSTYEVYLVDVVGNNNN